MPIVPGQTLRSVSPSGLPSVTQSPLPASAFGTIRAEQDTALAGAVNNYAQGQAKIEISMLDEANKLRVEEAVNKARQDALNLAYDEKLGYLAQKGAGAVYRASGKDLSTEYADRYRESLRTIAEGLGNPEQRKMFGERALSLETSFLSDVQRHQLHEYTQHAISVHDGSAKLAAETAMRNWQDPGKVEASIAEAKAGIARANAYRSGVSANETERQQSIVESHVHRQVIKAAIMDGNPVYAMKYLERNSKRMTENDILEVNGVINRDLDALGAQTAVSATYKELAPRFEPPDQDRLFSVMRKKESGDRDFNEDGTPVTSKKGAKYGMQVLPATAGKPGYGVAPAAADTPKEYNRVGEDYMRAMLREYNGNLEKALAAYNMGPNNFNRVLAEAKAAGEPNNWMKYVSKDVRKYVTEISEEYGAGAGIPTPPTKMEFIEQSVAKLGPNARPSTIAMTREAAAKQYNLILESRKEKADDTLAQVQRTLYANGGDLARVPPVLMNQLAQYGPGKIDDAKRYAKAIAEGDVKTNEALYLKLTVYPEELGRMKDAEFEQLREHLSREHFDRFAKRREEILSGKDDMSAGSLNRTVVLQTFEARMDSLDIKKPKLSDSASKRAEYGARLSYVEDALYAQQKELGRKMTPEETTKAIDAIFAKDFNFQRTFLGIKTGVSGSMRKMQMSVSDIPAADKAQITESFKRAGVSNPTDSDLLRAYLGKK